MSDCQHDGVECEQSCFCGCTDCENEVWNPEIPETSGLE